MILDAWRIARGFAVCERLRPLIPGARCQARSARATTESRQSRQAVVVA
jgi:hypothetical protein